MGDVRIWADELIMALENHSYELRFYLDRQTGEVFPVVEGNEESDEDRERIEADIDRFVFIDPIHSSEAWRVMEAFVLSLRVGRMRSGLERALSARHPFRAFKDELSGSPRLLEAWYEFHDREWLEMAKEWLDDWRITATLVARTGAGAPDDLDET